MVLDVTTTAMPRPDIVDQTFNSWTNRLKDVDWKNSTLYINVDPFSPQDLANDKRKDVVAVACKYFGAVVSNLPGTPNYTQAYNWVWSRVKKPFVLNLEDDWVLKRDIGISEIMREFKRKPSLQEVVFRAYSYEYPCYCTSPAIVRKEWCHAFGGKLNPEINPETQIHVRSSQDKFGYFIPCRKQIRESPDYRASDYIIAYPYARGDIVAIDIGRKWSKQADYDRPQVVSGGKKCYFTSWEKR